MEGLRVLLDPGGDPDSTFSDPDETLDRSALRERVSAAAEALASLEPMRLCLPVTSDLSSMVLLIAALESRHSVIPVPGGEAFDPPPFTAGVVTPDKRGAPFFEFQPSTGARAVDEPDRVYLRTSGSTGDPKWAVHSTERMVRAAAGVIERLELSSDDRVMLPVPLHHSYGLSTALIPSLLAGASVHIVPRGNPLTVFAAQRRFAPTVMFMVPSQCRSMMALGRKPGKVRLAVVAGDKLGADEAAAFEEGFGKIVNLYGSTELNAISAGRPSDPPELRHPFTGPPLAGMELALLPTADPDAAEGAQVMRVRHQTGLLGYASHASGEMTVDAGEYCTTGDLVRRHDEDRIEVLGRTDFAVNRDGLLVHISDIETCLSRVAGVAQAVVVIAGTTRRGAGLHALCMVEEDAQIAPEDILAACSTVLPPRAIPDSLEIAPELPLLPSGKFDRRALKARVLAALDETA